MPSFCQVIRPYNAAMRRSRARRPAASHTPSSVFSVGELAPVSGIYAVIHTGHRDEHRAVILRDEMFPQCAICGAAVYFRLMMSEVRLIEDQDFTPY